MLALRSQIFEYLLETFDWCHVRVRKHASLLFVLAVLLHFSFLHHFLCVCVFSVYVYLLYPVRLACDAHTRYICVCLLYTSPSPRD